MLSLCRLTPQDGEDIFTMLQSIPEEENGFLNPMRGCTDDQYRQWLIQSNEESNAVGLTDGWKVPQTVYWLYADGNPVGFGKLRHFLTDALRADGGHVGYAIRPGERGKGYGTALLRLLAEQAGDIGIDRLLLTIHRGNDASLRAAQKAGGVIESENDDFIYVWLDTKTPVFSSGH